MRLLTREELQSLLSPHPEPCLSIFMPTHRHAPSSAADPILYKNLLKQAERYLTEKYDSKQVDALLEPVAALPTPEFWRDRSDGLAVFHAKDFSAFYRLPVSFPEIVVVADSFHVQPLLRFLQSNRTYYILVLSQKAVSLHVGTATGVKPVDLAGMPKSLTDALGIERIQLLENSRRLTGGGGRTPVYQGGGAPDASRKDDLVRFFRAIDNALVHSIREERAPLFLAGAAYTFPIYREISRYPYLAPGGVEGSFEGATPEELHAKAWPVVRTHLASLEEDAIADFSRMYDRKLASDILTEVAKAAVSGRVRKLLLGEGKQLFGRIDPTTGEVTLHGRQIGPVDDDVLDDLAEVVLARGGEILVLEQGRMPGDAAAAATFRW